MYIWSMKYTVYIIRHIGTGAVLYVGKTRNFKRRAYEHLSLKSNSKYWLSSIGTNNVLIESVAEFDNETDALKYEDELILKYSTIANGYNKQRSGLIESENPEEYKRDWNREYYQKNNKCRERIKKYQRTEKYKEIRREYSKTNKYKEYQRKWNRDYRQAKKLGITVAEYRKLKKDQDTTFEQNKKQPIQLTINF